MLYSIAARLIDFIIMLKIKNHIKNINFYFKN